jgi:hypothetical protein
MFEKYRQSPVGAWHSAQEFSDSPKNGRPNATPLHLMSHRRLLKHPLTALPTKPSPYLHLVGKPAFRLRSPILLMKQRIPSYERMRCFLKEPYKEVSKVVQKLSPICYIINGTLSRIKSTFPSSLSLVCCIISELCDIPFCFFSVGF